MLWCGSVNYAKKHFKNIVLITEEKGKKLLIDKLNLPFNEVWELPSIPDELVHVYDLPKLHGHLLMAQRGIHALHVDYDAFLKKKLPDHILNAQFTAEYRYEPKPFAININKNLPVPLLDKLEVGLAAGIAGGCDTDGIINYTSKSIGIATDPRNREFLMKQNGFQASILFGEIASGSQFKDTAEVILPRGSNFVEDYRKLGYIHLAGLKKDRGAMAEAMLQVQISFPNEFMETGLRYEELTS